MKLYTNIIIVTTPIPVNIFISSSASSDKPVFLIWPISSTVWPAKSREDPVVQFGLSLSMLMYSISFTVFLSARYFLFTSIT